MVLCLLIIYLNEKSNLEELINNKKKNILIKKFQIQILM